MKGIVLAGGAGTRLFPATRAFSKQLIPLYGKPMVYYPISVLMLAGIREIMIITTPDDQPLFKKLLGDGSQLGVTFAYKVQERPEGIAQAFILAEEFLAGDDACLILGDNVFYGQSFDRTLRQAIQTVEVRREAVVFSYYVRDPERYGVVEFDDQYRVLSIEEKPQVPKSNYAVVGLYFYPGDVVKTAREVKPSARGELEITTLNQMYLEQGRLSVQPLGRGFAWLDTGTFESLHEAEEFIRAIERRQGLQVANLEEIAYNKKWITRDDVMRVASQYKGSDYAAYLLHLIKQG